MTIDELIEQLQRLRKEAGGTTEVRMMDYEPGLIRYFPINTAQVCLDVLAPGVVITNKERA